MEEVTSPVHEQEEESEIDVEIELPTLKKPSPTKHASMIKTASSRPPIPVSALTRKFETNKYAFAI